MMFHASVPVYVLFSNWNVSFFCLATVCGVLRTCRAPCKVCQICHLCCLSVSCKSQCGPFQRWPLMNHASLRVLCVAPSTLKPCWPVTPSSPYSVVEGRPFWLWTLAFRRPVCPCVPGPLCKEEALTPNGNREGRERPPVPVSSWTQASFSPNPGSRLWVKLSWMLQHHPPSVCSHETSRRTDQLSSVNPQNHEI